MQICISVCVCVCVCVLNPEKVVITKYKNKQIYIIDTSCKEILLIAVYIQIN